MFKVLSIVNCLLGVGILVSSCSFKVDSVQVGEVRAYAPAPHGFSPFAGPWRQIQFKLSSDQLRGLVRGQSTVFLGFNDCRGQVLFSSRAKLNQRPIEQTGHIWLKGYHISEVHLLEKREVDLLLRDPLLTSYIDEGLYASTPRICAFFKGGNMIGYSVPKSEFRLK